MSNDPGTSASAGRKETNKRKIRALLAGGLVLGIGAAVTLAAWSDNVFGKTEFSTTSWNIQGSFSNTGTPVWNEYATADDAGVFSFTLEPLDLVPGVPVHAPVSLRIGPDPSGSNANVQLLGATGGTGDLAAALRYSVYQGVSASECNQGDLTAAGASAWVGTASNPVALSVGSATDDLLLSGDQTAVNLCFAVTLPEDADPVTLSGQTTGELVWQFAGTSS
ncbi:putative ribosomally synthesized peptide with SipW-like signal peptide [Rhodococcus sp. 27YEA15]|uniref:SipW-dependent-type signal peptide-containing protein n=1 Tax=Rhodococcus sp. 27YEA15 TaxID=3156259 RepID=UPI003C7BBDED